MGGTLDRRIGYLERRAGVSGENSEFCSCPGPVTVTVDWGDEPEAAAAICPRCGRPIRTVTVTWDDLPGENWD